MALPKQKEIEEPLLREIAKRGGGVKPDRQLFEAVAAYFDLTQQDRAEKQPSGTKKWENMVWFARLSLVKKGQIDNSVPSIWRITDKGRARIGLPPSAGTEIIKKTTEQERVQEKQSQQQASEDIRLQLKGKLLNLSPQQFEGVVGKLLKALGAEEVNITGRTGDGGIDAEGIMPIFNIKVAVQAKRYAPQNSVGIDPVQRLVGSVVTGGYACGIFITTSSFTHGAKEIAERPGSKVVLVDGEKLVDIMIEKGLGMRDTPVVNKELDEGFFRSITV